MIGATGMTAGMQAGTGMAAAGTARGGEAVFTRLWKFAGRGNNINRTDQTTQTDITIPPRRQK